MQREKKTEFDKTSKKFVKIKKKLSQFLSKFFEQKEKNEKMMNTKIF
jgi:hypothetical protein